MSSQSQGVDGAPLDAVGRSAQALLIAAGVLLVLPALMGGALVAFGLRAAGLRLTWTPLFGVVLCAPLVVAVRDNFRGITELARAFAVIDPPSTVAVAAVLWPWWLAAVSPVALGLRLWLDRRDRLHGGDAERRAAAALGPLRLLARAWRRRTGFGHPCRPRGRCLAAPEVGSLSGSRVCERTG